MRPVCTAAASCTPFGKLADSGFHDLARRADLEALADCGLAAWDAALIEKA